VSHEASAWIERQITDTMGARVGYVYKTEDDLIQTYQPGRPISAFTVPFSFTDIGVDGRAGTADDATIQMLGMPNASAANFPVNSVVQNTPRFGKASTFEASINKRYGNRWSASGGFSYTAINDFFSGSYPNNPNQPGAADRSLWSFKASGSYDGPAGIRFSPVIRHQSGANYARTVTISAPAACACTATGTAYVDAVNANREDNIWVFDVRAEKQLTFGSRVRLRMMFDAFNLANSHASETISRATGLGYLKPSAILAPRTARVGFRFIF
jgi:hypothetical protein